MNATKHLILKSLADKPQSRLLKDILLQMVVRTNDDEHRNHMRVDVNPDGTLNIVDFTLPSLGKKQERNIPQEDVPKWILSTVSVLRVATEGDLVEGIGFKVSDRLYFIADRRGV